MDGSAFDLLILTWIEWVYDKLEDRYGRVTAWLVTVGTALMLIGILVWVLVALSR